MTDAASLADRVREGDLRLHELEAHADADTAAEARRLLVESQSGASLDAVGNYGFPAEAAESAIENMVGSIQVPMGVAGPVSVDGGSVAGESTSPRDHRGRAPRVGQPRLLGHQQRRRLTARVLKSGMTRAPVFRVADVAEAEALVSWTRDNFAALKEAAEDDEPRRTPRRDAVRRRQLGVPAIPLRHQGRDGDEHGHHRHRGRLRRRRSRDSRLARRPLGATSVPTKPAAINAVEGRGRSVTADVRIPREVVEERLHTTPEAVAELNTRKNLVGSAKAASLGFNAHVANVVAAMFLATGQDEAQVVEGANAITTAEVQDGDLYVSVSIASLEVGTVGGGTKLRRSPGPRYPRRQRRRRPRRLQRRRPRQMHRRRFPRGRTLPSLRARLAAPLQRPRRTRSVTAWGLLSDRDS